MSVEIEHQIERLKTLCDELNELQNELKLFFENIKNNGFTKDFFESYQTISEKKQELDIEYKYILASNKHNFDHNVFILSNPALLRKKIKIKKQELELETKINSKLGLKATYKANCLQEEVEKLEKILQQLSNSSDGSSIKEKDFIKFNMYRAKISESLSQIDVIKKDLISYVYSNKENKLLNILNNERLSAWQQIALKIYECISSSGKFVHLNHSERQYLSTRYLLHLILTGKINFRVLHQSLETGELIMVSNSLSFKNAFDKFLEQNTEDIIFDTLSPMFLPYGDMILDKKITPYTITDPRKLTPLSGKSFDDIANFIMYKKVNDLIHTKENWLFSLVPHKAFTDKTLNKLYFTQDFYTEDDLFTNIELSHLKWSSHSHIQLDPSMKEWLVDYLHYEAKDIKHVLDKFKHLIISAKKNHASIKKFYELLDLASQYPKNNLYELVYQLCQDEDLSKYTQRIETTSTITRIPSHIKENIFDSDNTSSRSRVSYLRNNTISKKITLISNCSDSEKNGEILFPISYEGYAFSKSFMPFFEYLNTILLENFPKNKSLSWSLLFYIFLEVNGITFDRDSLFKNCIYIPVANERIGSASKETTSCINNLTQTFPDNISWFFNNIFISFSEVNSFIAEDKIYEYYLKPFTSLEKIVSPKTVKTHKKKFPEKSPPELVYECLDELLTASNSFEIQKSIAKLINLLNPKILKANYYQYLFLPEAKFNSLYSNLKQIVSTLEKSKNNADDNCEHKEITMQILAELDKYNDTIENEMYKELFEKYYEKKNNHNTDIHDWVEIIDRRIKK